ncbi:lipid II:glycine glycyltransferase FemX [Oceanobacillus sp. CAU 1775]
MAILDKTNKDLVNEYDEFVRSSPFRSMTQDRRWTDVKEGWGEEYVYLKEDGKIIAAMSILIKRLPGGYSMLYAPRGPVCDIYDLDLVQRLIKEVDSIAKKYKAIMLKFDPEASYSDELYSLYKNAGFKLTSKDDEQDNLIQPRLNMVLPLEGHDEESIMMRFSNKLRSDIRRGIKRGVETRYSRDDKDIELFYDAYKIMSERNKINIRPLEYFKQIRDSYENARIYISYHEDDILSAALTINYYGKLYYLYAGSTNVKRNLSANQVMNYEMIKWGIEEGAIQYDFGGFFEISQSDGLYAFKKRFLDKDGHVEYIGEINKVYKPLMYNIFEKGLPLVKKIRNRGNND